MAAKATMAAETAAAQEVARLVATVARGVVQVVMAVKPAVEYSRGTGTSLIDD